MEYKQRLGYTPINSNSKEPSAPVPISNFYSKYLTLGPNGSGGKRILAIKTKRIFILLFLILILFGIVFRSFKIFPFNQSTVSQMIKF